MTNAERIAAIQTELDGEHTNYMALIAAGAKAYTDYSVDGESYQYNAAKDGHLRRIKELTAYLQMLQPFNVRQKVIP